MFIGYVVVFVVFIFGVVVKVEYFVVIDFFLGLKVVFILIVGFLVGVISGVIVEIFFFINVIIMVVGLVNMIRGVNFDIDLNMKLVYYFFEEFKDVSCFFLFIFMNFLK